MHLSELESGQNYCKENTLVGVHEVVVGVLILNGLVDKLQDSCFEVVV